MVHIHCLLVKLSLTLRKNSDGISTVAGVVVSLKLLHGELVQVQQDNPLLFKNLTITQKLGFSDVIMPGDCSVRGLLG